MNSDIDALQTAIEAIGNISGWKLIAALTAAGTIAMAMLQLVKDLTPIRRIFQRWWLRGWINAHVDAFNKARGDGKKDLLPVSAEKAQALLVELATGGDSRALYELSAEQLVAQMNAATQITLDYPKQYYDLLVVASEGADIDDVGNIVAQSPRATRSKDAAPPPPSYLEARARVGHRIQRNLDGIQIALGSRWQFWMQIIAISLSVLLLEAAVIYTSGFRTGTILMALPIGVLGGYLAPVARDLVAALQTLRK